MRMIFESEEYGVRRAVVGDEFCDCAMMILQFAKSEFGFIPPALFDAVANLSELEDDGEDSGAYKHTSFDLNDTFLLTFEA